MKRTAVFIIAMFTVTAFADQQDAPDRNIPPMPFEKGFNRPFKGAKETVNLTKEAAKAKLSAYISSNLKGFEIKEINSVFLPFGSIHQAVVTDANDNRFYLDITPDGEIRGPVPVKK